MLTSLKQLVTNRRGASLIIALGLTVVLLLLAAGTSSVVLTFMRSTHQVEQANAAYFAAEGSQELALYDLAGFDAGYETNDGASVCGPAVDLTVASFTSQCGASSGTNNSYRLLNFTDTASGLSGARGFWQIFAQAMKDKTTQKYVVPNPYFVGDKDGELELPEWSRLTKTSPISLSLMIDNKPGDDPPTADPDVRYTYLDPSQLSTARLMLATDPSDTGLADPTWSSGVDPDGSDPRSSEEEDVAVWTLSAIDGSGAEHTLQGVVWESDLSGASTTLVSGRSYSMYFNFKNSNACSSVDPQFGSIFAGEDINKNIGASATTAGFNRIANSSGNFDCNTPKDFFDDMITASTSLTTAWHDARLTVSLVGTLSETTGLKSDSLLYYAEVIAPSSWAGGKPLADETIHIVSEGFAGLVKQTIETSFRPESTIPVFSYAIFQ